MSREPSFEMRNATFTTTSGASHWPLCLLPPIYYFSMFRYLLFSNCCRSESPSQNKALGDLNSSPSLFLSFFFFFLCLLVSCHVALFFFFYQLFLYSPLFSFTQAKRVGRLALWIRDGDCLGLFRPCGDLSCRARSSASMPTVLFKS